MLHRTGNLGSEKLYQDKKAHKHYKTNSLEMKVTICDYISFYKKQ